MILRSICDARSGRWLLPVRLAHCFAWKRAVNNVMVLRQRMVYITFNVAFWYRVRCRHFPQRSMPLSFAVVLPGGEAL